MKIGILTHHYVSNYGAYLQAYALAETIAKEFPEDTVEIIDYINIKHYVTNFAGWFRYYRSKENWFNWKQKIRVPFTFVQERKRHLRLSPGCYTTGQVNRLRYDVIVVGSDEVWNYQDKKSTAKIKFGHGLDCRHIIAYAPSVGNSDENVVPYVRDGLQRFAAISARDDRTGKLAEKLTGQTVEQVLDPTFLHNIPEEESKQVNKPYILFYYCDRLPRHIKSQIVERARQAGMAVYGAGECDACYDDITVNLTPFEWADMFRNAEFVFTGTFHGAVFSILNRRQFKVYLTNKSRIQKVGDLLNSLGIQNREIDDRFVFDPMEKTDKIDYQAVDKLLNKRRRQSLDWLCKAVEAGRNA